MADSPTPSRPDPSARRDEPARPDDPATRGEPLTEAVPLGGRPQSGDGLSTFAAGLGSGFAATETHPPPPRPHDHPTVIAPEAPPVAAGPGGPIEREDDSGFSLSADALGRQFDRLVGGDAVNWTIEYSLLRLIGSGGQGRVFLGDRIGSFGVHFRVALKFFEPRNYASAEDYLADMARMARMAMRLARLQHDSLLDIYNVVEIDGVQVLAMEWIDGFDLRQLLDVRLLDRTQQRVPDWRFDYINDVVVTRDEPLDDEIELATSRLQPGVAVSIARECLTGLAALHRAGIVHADVKPANIMIKRTGHSKMIDVGSSFTLDDPPRRTSWTPRYAAIEVMAGARPSPASDLASLGYSLLEMLTGRLPWEADASATEQMEIKRYLHDQVPDLLPGNLAEDTVLSQFIRRLIHPDPTERFDSAEAADFDEDGAAAFHRRLVKGDLDSEYQNELRMWLSDIA